MIYIDEHIDEFDLHEALLTVSQQRRLLALRYRNERDRRLCVAAYRLLQRALATEYGIVEPPSFCYDSAGKPMLSGFPEVHFSMSHCREAVACVVSDTPVGIDIEAIDQYDPEVAASVMSDSEIHLIMTSPRPDVAFVKLWTMKECLYKLSGDNHHGDISHMLDHKDRHEFNTIMGQRWVCTVCRRARNL